MRGPSPRAACQLIVMGVETLPSLASLADVLRHRAETQPDERAYLLLSERGGEEAVLSFAELERRACLVAAQLSARLRKGDRALLVFPAGLDFMVAFFGCLVAGMIAVPMMVPRRASTQDSSAAIVADCGASLAMTSGDLASVRPDVIQRYRDAGLDWLLLDGEDAAARAPHIAVPAHQRDDIAFLQYTSGSTSSPKGVMVTHGSLLENLDMIRLALGNTRSSTYAQLGAALSRHGSHPERAAVSLYVGAPCVLMPPVSFIQRPLAWLRAIHAYRAELDQRRRISRSTCASAGFAPSTWPMSISRAGSSP